ncbi:MAG TPA: antibiotic ABC transporter ATP-binding protein [Bacteroidales bacterium]|nr:antibiotic ABC transporter ATP-binding protein [Bacteroidales bacterium]
MSSFSKIFSYLLPYKGLAFFSILFVFLSAFFSLFSLALVAPFLKVLFGETEMVTESVAFGLNANSIIHNFNYILSQIILEKGKVQALVFVGIIVLVTSLFKNIFLYYSKVFIVPIRTGIVKHLRDLIFNKILILPLSYFSEEKKGDLMSRMAQDVQEIEVSVVRSLEMLFRDPILILTYLAALFYMSPKLSMFVLVLLPLSGFLIGKIGKTLRSKSFQGQKKLGLIMSVFEETIGGLRIVKAFNAEEKMHAQFDSVNASFTQLQAKIFRRQQLASPLSEFLGILVMVIVLWYGGAMVLGENSTLSSSVLITYLVVFSQIINPAKAVTTAYYNILKGLASNDRIEEILGADISIKEKENPQVFSEFKHSIEYKNVHFKYDKDTVLHSINLTIKKGKAIALVGPSGAGKSTLVDLLPRFIDVSAGEVLIDGINVKDFKLKELRNLMGIVSQQSILFNDTFFNNIAFGIENATEEDVIAAAKVANAHDFIMETQNGYYTNVGEGGSKLSGGQRQRISIARAVLKNPPILILDEATSALDTESERLVQDAILKLMKNRTSIVIAHRLSTVKHSDQIVVLSEGGIIEKGKHDELLQMDSGIYTKLHKLQMY